ncbi:MAG: 4'-phosphopantetheinyl transferase superfamily protein [Pseudomonadales bacterium]
MLVRLSPHEVHIWMADVQQVPARMMESYLQLMDQPERDRNTRYKTKDLRNLDCITRALLRSTLSSYIAKDPADWVFNVGPFGKPAIVGSAPELFFNLSHTSRYVVCAVSTLPGIGIDIENSARQVQVLQLAKRFFSAQEYRDLSNLPEEEQRERFFDLWTLKESYIKARGEGISLGLDKFSFELQPDAKIRICCDKELGDTPEYWRFSLSQPSGDHRMALAIKMGDKTTDLQLKQFITVPLQDTTGYSGFLSMSGSRNRTL